MRSSLPLPLHLFGWAGGRGGRERERELIGWSRTNLWAGRDCLKTSRCSLGFPQKDWIFGVIGRLSSVSFANFCCSFFSSIPPDLATQAGLGCSGTAFAYSFMLLVGFDGFLRSFWWLGCSANGYYSCTWFPFTVRSANLRHLFDHFWIFFFSFGTWILDVTGAYCWLARVVVAFRLFWWQEGPKNIIFLARTVSMEGCAAAPLSHFLKGNRNPRPSLS